MMILYGCLVLGMMACATLAIRASQLVASSLWLAALSALLAVFIYLLGAPRIAVIELSVGAGLVTVLLVFAVAIAGDTAAAPKPVVPRPVMWGLGGVVLLLLGRFVLPLVAAPPPASEPSLANLLWQGRALDVVIQVVLIFCGVVGVLGLLAEAAPVQVAERDQVAPGSRIVPGQVDSAPEPTTERKEVRL